MNDDRPTDEGLVKMVEKLASDAYRTRLTSNYFTFFGFDRSIEQVLFNYPGTVRSWITRSKERFSESWADAEAVVLSYCGKRICRINVVIRGTSQAFSLDVNLKTGAMTWKQSESRATVLLKETLEGARR